MVRIHISDAAYAALGGDTAFEGQRSPLGGFAIWLDHGTLARLKAYRRSNEGFSEAILRLAAETS